MGKEEKNGGGGGAWLGIYITAELAKQAGKQTGPRRTVETEKGAEKDGNDDYDDGE